MMLRSTSFLLFSSTPTTTITTIRNTNRSRMMRISTSSSSIARGRRACSYYCSTNQFYSQQQQITTTTATRTTSNHLFFSIRNNNNNNQHRWRQKSLLLLSTPPPNNRSLSLLSSSFVVHPSLISTTTTTTTTTPLSPFHSTSSSLLSGVAYNNNKYQHQQCRSYLYLPLSWTELKIRLRTYWEKEEQQRKVYVKLFKENYWNSKKESTIRMRWNDTNNKFMKENKEYMDRKKQMFKEKRELINMRWNDRKQRWMDKKELMNIRWMDRKQRLKDRKELMNLRWKDKKQKFQEKKEELLFKYSSRRWKESKKNIPFRAKAVAKTARIWVRAIRNRMVRSTTRMKKSIQSIMMNQRTKQIAMMTGKKKTNDSYIIKPIIMKEYFEPHWFDSSTGRPISSKDETNKYVNPWMSLSTDGVQSILSILSWKYERFIRLYKEIGWKLLLPEHLRNNNKKGTTNKTSTDSTKHSSTQQKTESIAQCIPTTLLSSSLSNTNTNTNHNNNKSTIQKNKKVDLKNEPIINNINDIKFTWIGHSTCLIQTIDNITILTDPIFSNRASPYQNIPFIGMLRDVPPIPSTIEELPIHNDDNNNKIIDIVLISHDHYDHLDKNTCQKLQQLNIVKLWIVPMGIKLWLQEKCNIPESNIIELEWWESVQLLKKKQRQEQEQATTINATKTKLNNNDSNNDNNDNNNTNSSCGNSTYQWHIIDRRALAETPTHPALLLSESSSYDDNNDDHVNKYTDDATTTTTTTSSSRLMMNTDTNNKNASFNSSNSMLWVSCLPVQHWSSRTFWDRNQRLWCSFAVFFCHPYNNNNNNKGQHHIKSFYFAGDTALPTSFPLFQQIRDFLGGSVDLAAIPIGAYEPAYFMKDAHVNPEEAVIIHQTLNCKRSIGIHWGTFPLSEEPMNEPAIRLRQAACEAGIDDAFTTIPIGESITHHCTRYEQLPQQQRQQSNRSFWGNADNNLNEYVDLSPTESTQQDDDDDDEYPMTASSQ